MRRFVVAPPAHWNQSEPGRYRVGEVTITIGALGPLPEDRRAWLEQALDKPGIEVKRGRLGGGWPAATAEVPGKLALLLQIVDHGVLVTLEGPPAALETARAEALGVLAAGHLEWGEPAFLTLAEILDGVPR